MEMHVRRMRPYWRGGKNAHMSGCWNAEVGWWVEPEEHGIQLRMHVQWNAVPYINGKVVGGHME
jgi:hypothetical protein